MRVLAREEMNVVSGGETTQVGDVVVVGQRRMSDDQIRDILESYYNNMDGYSGGGSYGGGGGGTAAPPPPPVVYVQEEDTDGDGQIDTLWIDNDGDGYIGVGDGAAFLDNGPWSNLNSFQLNSVMEGLKGWMAEKGLEVAAILGGTAVGTMATGESAAAATIRAGSGMLMAPELSWMAHEILLATLGGIDFSETNQIQASGYAHHFGVYNPYTGGSSSPGTGSGSGSGSSGGSGSGGGGGWDGPGGGLSDSNIVQ